MYQGIAAYHKTLIEEQTSVEATVTYYLNQIKNRESLNAFVEVFNEEALEKAKALDEARKNGAALKKLHGVVIAIKDVISYNNHSLTASSKILQGYKAPFTASALQLLIDEDAIIIGSLNCDEFAMGSTNENSFYGAVKNPINEAYVAGGSSGGTAAAVAANCCMLALGSDTGGSVRQPADYCGVYGYKPSYGGFSRYGLIAYGSSFDQIGIVANNIADIKLLSEIMGVQDPKDSTSLGINWASNKKEHPLTLGYYDAMLNHEALDPTIKSKIYERIAQCRSKGIVVKELSFDLLNYIIPTYYVLATAEASSNLGRYDGIRYGHRTNEGVDLQHFYAKNRTEGFGKEVQKRILLGNFVLSSGYYDAYFSKAQQVRQLLVTQANANFKEVDAIIMPVAPTTAPKLGNSTSDPTVMYAADIYTVLANLIGAPAIAMPLEKHENGLPFGWQIMATKENDAALLAIAMQIDN
jgi:aspartyl-tRNA(Asn)/glutamyl-tRNA(Gln) amidotransferase subunit A